MLTIGNFLRTLQNLNEQVTNLFANTTVSNAICGNSALNIFNVSPGNIKLNKKKRESTQTSSGSSIIDSLINFNNLINSTCPINSALKGSVCFCESIIAEITGTEIGKVIYDQLVPILKGKLYYAPNTPAYNDVIQNMNLTFASIISFKDNLNNVQSLQSLVASIEALVGNNSIVNFEQLNNNLNMLSVASKFLQNVLNCVELDKFVGFANENDAVKAAMKLVPSNTIWAVIIFNENNNRTVLDNQITYKIRMNPVNTHNTFSYKDKSYKYGPNNCLTCNYDFLFGYIYIQDLLEKSIIQTRTNSSYNFGVTTQMTPYPCYLSDAFTQAISQSLPLFMVLAWIFTVSMIIKDIVYEKEKRLKEFMRVMGLSNGIHWLAWFCTSFLIVMTISILLAIILKYGQIIVNTDFSVLIVFFCCFI